ncbi:MAG: CpaF family protein [Chloroflexota bacterium]|nr:CpaF family protein [Chloroflexota bacterium]
MNAVHTPIGDLHAALERARRPRADAVVPATAVKAPSSNDGIERAGCARVRTEKEQELVHSVHTRVTPALGRLGDEMSRDALNTALQDEIATAVREHDLRVTDEDRGRLLGAVLDELVGLGPIQVLVDDDDLTEVMVNGPEQVWIERNGKLFLTDVRFRDADHVTRIIQRIVAPIGRRCDESSPMVDARLADGSRVNAIIPPLSLVGPVLTIRKFRRAPLTPADLLQNGTIGPEALEFLSACVRGRLNVIVAGGTGAGKTTLLNTLSSFIGARERVVTIEDAAELRLAQVHVITLESRPPNIEGQGTVTIRDLFRNALRMRPDRIVIGECRSAEALDMLQAMNTGHDGSLTTIHSNGPRDALARVETMVLLAADLPLRAIREQIAAAIDLVVYVERMQDGQRRVTQITEVRGMEGEIITMQDIYSFQRRGFDGERISGALLPTGIRPGSAEKLMAHGIDVPPKWFGYGDAR